MKEIYIIRHAESISNAGEITNDHNNIPLTEKGRGQAEELAKTFTVEPELIVLSSYTRTKETAMPFINRNPTVPIETWDVEEFTYLDPAIYNGTSKKDRAIPSFNYWKEADIHHKTADEAESFYEFSKRIEKFVEQLRERKEKRIVVFSHGRFIYGLNVYLSHLRTYGEFSLNETDISKLKEIHTKGVLEKEPFPIGNTSVHRIEI